MNPARIRKLVLLYPLFMILCGIGYVKYGHPIIDGDTVAFMDISDAIRTHDWSLVINGYWNPAYAGALALGQMIAHPSRWTEVQTFFWVNFVIFVACIAGYMFFVQSLLRVREQFVADTDSLPAFSQPALQLASLGLLFASFQRELTLGAIRSDSLLLLFFLLAAAFLLRLQRTGHFIYYPLLGVALGFAYLTKSFAFLPSGILLASLFIFSVIRKGPRRNRRLTGVLIAGIIFAAIAGPYILGISRQRGRFTTGESARINYCFFVDQTGRWHEWHSGDLGHATAEFKHHEELIVASPPVYSYAQHPFGTYPLWFDPSYWTDGLTPQFYLGGHILRLERTPLLLMRYIIGHLEAFLLGGTLLLFGCFIGRRRGVWLPLIPVLLWGLLMIGIYFPIDLQDRYLTGAFLFVVIPGLAILRRPRESCLGEVATGMSIILAGVILAVAISNIGEQRRQTRLTEGSNDTFSRETYTAARELAGFGVAPGSTVACFGDAACYVNHYWARLAQTPIRAELEVPDNSDPGAFWKKVGDKQAVLDALRAQHIRAIVGRFALSDHPAEGWHQLGSSDFYAYIL